MESQCKEVDASSFDGSIGPKLAGTTLKLFQRREWWSFCSQFLVQGTTSLLLPLHLGRRVAQQAIPPLGPLHSLHPLWSHRQPQCCLSFFGKSDPWKTSDSMATVLANDNTNHKLPNSLASCCTAKAFFEKKLPSRVDSEPCWNLLRSSSIEDGRVSPFRPWDFWSQVQSMVIEKNDLGDLHVQRISHQEIRAIRLRRLRLPTGGGGGTYNPLARARCQVIRVE